VARERERGEREVVAQSPIALLRLSCTFKSLLHSVQAISVAFNFSLYKYNYYYNYKCNLKLKPKVAL